MSVRVNLVTHISIGRSFSVPLLFQSEGAVDPIDGKRVILSIKYAHEDPDSEALLIKEFIIPAADPEGLQGRLAMVLTPAETAVFPIGTFAYEVVLVTPGVPDDEIIPYIWGSVCCREA